jgi:hypothetical protein
MSKPFSEGWEIDLKLDRYDDIFSDFDIRPYSRRALSVDFLDELRRASYEKDNDGIEIVLNVPSDERNESSEGMIRRRLKDHFRKHFRMLEMQKNRMRRRGVAMIVFGVAAMISAAMIMFGGAEEDLFKSFLVVFLEPAAWFLFWEGLNTIIYGSKDIEAHYNFYRKMSHNQGKIHFRSY